MCSKIKFGISLRTDNILMLLNDSPKEKKLVTKPVID